LELFTADATALSTTKQNLENTAIVTESYLGRLFTPGNTYEKNIIEEKKNLMRIYEGFLREL